MTDFTSFARAHGVLIDTLQEDGRWHRVPTETHPRKKNGAYRYLGSHGHVQDHATMTEPALWTPDEATLAKIDHEAIAQRAAQAAREIREGQQRAAARAGWVMHQCERGGHPYLTEKGFPDWNGLIWRDPKAGDVKLCIPMRVGSAIVGIQTISDQPGFEKRFLPGQRISEATFMFGSQGPKVFVEGFATGLSVHRAIQAMKLRAAVVVTFNAGNLAKVAKYHGAGLVVADHDKPGPHAPEPGGTGLKVARDIGLTFWHSPVEGQDANDYEKARGTLALGMALKPLVMAVMREARAVV